MKEFKGTPGPWALDESRHEGSINRLVPFRHIGIVSAYRATKEDEVENKANALLIAAAPDLLEALHGMLLHIREPESESEFQWPDHFRKQKDAFIAARAAIEKALGK